MPGTSSPSDPSSMLQAYAWDLAAATDGRGQAADWRVAGGPSVRLQFDQKQLSVRNLCNALGAPYELAGSRLRVGRPMGTLRACPDRALMALEQRVITLLPDIQHAELRSGGATPRLSLRFADGSRWELTGIPTPQTLYGSAGERLFLEVAPQRTACSHGVMKDPQCLRVREIRYAADGVKQTAGDWSMFYGEIEGFTHQPGVRTIVRVNRYKRENVPADASAYAYVLDMVVESERMR